MSLHHWQIATGNKKLKKLKDGMGLHCLEHENKVSFGDAPCIKNCDLYNMKLIAGIFRFFTSNMVIVDLLVIGLYITVKFNRTEIEIIPGVVLEDISKSITVKGLGLIIQYTEMFGGDIV